MIDLETVRASLDDVDKKIVQLYEERMKLVKKVATYKLQNHLPVLDNSREEQVLASRQAMLTNAHYRDDIAILFTTLMQLSRRNQEEMIAEATHD